MEIRYKSITHERMEDAPFIGALICAIECKFNCKGCFNQHLRVLPTQTKTAEEIIAEVKSNPFNEGIILSGLEWSRQPLEMVELATVASKAGLQVMIYTGLSLYTFQASIGRASAEKTGYAQMLEEANVNESDAGIYAFIGSMILDTVITQDYYIKCGKYEESELTTEPRVHFGVTLASNNQTIYKFTHENEDEEK